MDIRKISITISAFAITFIAWACTESAPVTTETPSDAKSNYAQYCVQCHGEDGKLGLAGAADLTSSVLDSEGKQTIITNGKGGMMPYKDMLSEDEIKALVNYIENDLP